MVTDAEYKALKAKVDNLEKRLNLLAQQYSALYMKQDIPRTQESSSDKPKRHKDITKYEFNGEVYSKRQLVLECVKYYINNNSINSYSKLIDVFPDYIQGSLGIVKDVTVAERYSNASKRFFFADQDVIHMKEGNFVVCSQWDVNNIERFIVLASDLGINIKPIKRKYK